MIIWQRGIKGANRAPVTARRFSRSVNDSSCPPATQVAHLRQAAAIPADLSRNLTARYGPGFSETNLTLFHTFYATCAIGHPGGDQLAAPAAPKPRPAGAKSAASSTVTRDLDDLSAKGIMQKIGQTGRGTHYLLAAKPDINPTRPTPAPVPMLIPSKAPVKTQGETRVKTAKTPVVFATTAPPKAATGKSCLRPLPKGLPPSLSNPLS